MGKAIVINNADFSTNKVRLIDLDDDTYSGLGLITYGSTDLYETSGGGSDAHLSISGNYFGIYPLVPAAGNGVLASVRCAYSNNKSMKVVVGTLDQNDFFIERLVVPNVPILGGKVETNLLPLGIKVKQGEYVFFQESDELGGAYFTSGNVSSNLSKVILSDMTVSQRTDGINSTLYYVINHG